MVPPRNMDSRADQHVVRPAEGEGDTYLEYDLVQGEMCQARSCRPMPGRKGSGGEGGGGLLDCTCEIGTLAVQIRTYSEESERETAREGERETQRLPRLVCAADEQAMVGERALHVRGCLPHEHRAAGGEGGRLPAVSVRTRTSTSLVVAY